MGTKITITEALSEINLISKKLQSKKDVVLGNLFRNDVQKDTFLNDGGSEAYIGRELQSINDLMRRVVSIRSSIAKANTENKITINDRTMTINEWLNWKRDVSEFEKTFFAQVSGNIKKGLDDSASRPQLMKADDGTIKIINITPNVNYADTLKKQQDVVEVLEKLDGQLSLKNATIFIEV